MTRGVFNRSWRIPGAPAAIATRMEHQHSLNTQQRHLTGRRSAAAETDRIASPVLPRISTVARFFLAAMFVVCALAAGCAESKKGPIVFYCDGAGWYSSGGGVQQGLKAAGYQGDFQTFTWSAFIGPAHDHFVNASDKGIARRLARRIETARKKDACSPIYLMGLSAGTSVALGALDQLKPGVQVDSVVLFSPSVSSLRDLTKIMQHVKHNLYATCSPHDAIIGGMAVNADGFRGPPAGRNGFRMPRGDEHTREAYRRVVNLPWQPAYLGFEWNGSHTGVTNSQFVSSVVAPRVLSAQPFPLDRPVAVVPARPGKGRES